MADQLGLFETAPTQQQINEAAEVGKRASRKNPARARNTDHDSSHIAAANVKAKIGERCRVLADMVRVCPGLTSRQLSELERCPDDMDRHEVARRMSDCEKRGLVRADRETQKQITYYPK